jgi:hypothetical protein
MEGKKWVWHLVSVTDLGLVADKRKLGGAGVPVGSCLRGGGAQHAQVDR